MSEIRSRPSSQSIRLLWLCGLYSWLASQIGLLSPEIDRQAAKKDTKTPSFHPVTAHMVIESSSSKSASSDWSRFRTAMPVTGDWAYFDHAAVGPLPQVAHEKILAWARQAAYEGDVNWLSWQEQAEDLRSLTAKILNASETEIGLIPNTTFGINIVAQGYPWQPGDNVVLPDNEFPSNAYPWLALESQGVEIRRVATESDHVCPDKIAAACDSKTRIVSCSWIGFASGQRIDPAKIAQVAHDHGALFFMDAIQGMGVFPIDVKKSGIDFLAADGHKWMLGPEGAGVFYIDQKHIDLIRPVMVGWKSVNNIWEFDKIELDLKPSACRFEGGSNNMAGLIGLGASLNLLHEFGLTADESPIASQILLLAEELATKLESAGAVIHSSRDDKIRTGIVIFELPGHDPVEIRAKLLDNKIVTSARGGGVRAAAHCYNNSDDIDRLVDVVSKLKI